jgi:hypothetical protein
MPNYPGIALLLASLAVAVSCAQASCSSFTTAALCNARVASGCAWCNDSYTPATSGICYDTKTEQCCSAYNDCQEGMFKNSACLKNQTCCTPMRAGPPTCCAPGMSCCQGECYDPKIHTCCPESYPSDLCGAPALCTATESCCMAYYSQCCPTGTYCCSDYHGNSGCISNDYPVVCNPEQCGPACPRGSACATPGQCSEQNNLPCIFSNGTCVPGW